MIILIFAFGLVALRILYSVGEVCYERDWPRSTWKGLLIALGVLCIAVSAFGQAARVDIPLLTYGPNVPSKPGPLPQALWVANATAYLCVHPSTTLAYCKANPITTYTDSTEGTPCPSTTPLVQLPGNTCTAYTGAASNLGLWYASGTFDYYVASSYGTFGPYTFNPPYPTVSGCPTSGCTFNGPLGFSGIGTASTTLANLGGLGANAPAISAALYCHGTSGNGSAYACTAPNIVTPYNPAVGNTILFVPDVTGNNTPTLNVNGSGAYLITGPSFSTLAAGQLHASAPILLTFSGTGWVTSGVTGTPIVNGGTGAHDAPGAASGIMGATVTGTVGTSSQATALPGPVGAPSFVGSNVPVIVPSAAYSAACNGTTDDHVIIQAAINYAAANNRAIQVVGTCNIGSTTILVPSGTQWMNQTSATLLYSGTGFAVDARGSSYYVIQNLNVNESNDAGSGFAIGGGGFVTLNNNYANGPNPAGNTGVGLLIDSTTGWSNNFILNNNYMEIFKFPFKFQTSASTGSIANLITGSGNYAYCANPSGTPITGSIRIWVDGLHLGNGEASTLSQMALEHCALPYQIDNGAYGPSLNGDFEANTSLLGTVGNTYTGTIWNVVTGNGPPLVYVNGMLGNYELVLTGATGTITGTVLSATCDSGTATVTGAVVGHPVAVSSTTGADVGAAFNLRASVTATGVVTVYVCGTGTPASLAFNVTVF